MATLDELVPGAGFQLSLDRRGGIWARAVWLLLALPLLVCCTTTTVQPELIRQPAAVYRLIAIGPVSASDEALGHTAAVLARRGLVAALAKSRQFTDVMDTVPNPPRPGTLLVSGKITEVDKGDIALRLIIGFGAGRARVAGHFNLSDTGGATLAEFSVSKEYAGGAGIGGSDFVDMDTLATQLGEAAADAIVSWAEKGAFQKVGAMP